MNLSKKDGRGSVDHKQPITKWDQEKLKIYHQDCSTPVKLQQKVFTDMISTSVGVDEKARTGGLAARSTIEKHNSNE